jgi:hypothetical protein
MKQLCIFFDCVSASAEDAFTSSKLNNRRKFRSITYDEQRIDDYFVSHDDLKKGKKLIITTE